MNPIRKYICCAKPTEQGANMSFLSIPGQTASKGREKVALAPKHGLMDWIRTMNNTPNISGTNGKLLHVTEEELAKHNKKTDCWIAISGNVYNITPYLDYHPGGVDEIMKGAGIDATALFQEIHSWVNYTSMLEKCLVGRLVSKHNPKENPSARAKSLPMRLRFDFRQPDTKTTTLFIYTQCVTITKENIFLYIENSKKIHVLVFIDGFVHTIAIDLLELVTNDFNIRISPNNRGQVEIDLTKQVEQMWKSIGKFLSKHLSVCSIQDFEPIYFPVTLIQRIPVTHDSDWYTFSLPSNVFMSPTIGYHVRLKRIKDGVVIVKPYTVVNKLNSQENSSSEQTIELLIKHYTDGMFTPMLQGLNIGDTIEMSSYDGTFDLTRIDLCKTLVLLAAGTGLTPMIRIINYAIKQINEKKDFKVVLLFFNKTRNDILCQDELQTIFNQNKFVVHHILSQPDMMWEGETGRIRKELLQRLLPSSITETLVCICGPTPFSKLANELLKELGYKDNHLHLFLG